MVHRHREPLLKAFLQTRYVVEHHSGIVTVRIHQPPPPALSGSDWLIITADNPAAKQHNEQQNRRHRAALLQALQGLATDCYPTRHIDPGGLWPDELGWLVLTTPCRPQQQTRIADSVVALGRRFGQRALVCHRCDYAGDGQDHAVELLWL